MRDALGTTWAGLVVSPRVLEVLDGCTGWEPVPVRITRRDGTVEEGYAEIGVTGRAGPIDHSLSERIMLRAMAPGGRPTPGLRGLRFDPSTWDGSDVFRPERSELTLVVADVAEALRRAKLTNLEIDPIDEIEFADI